VPIDPAFVGRLERLLVQAAGEAAGSALSGLAAFYVGSRAAAEPRTTENLPSVIPISAGAGYDHPDGRLPAGRSEPVTAVPSPVYKTEPIPLPQERTGGGETALLPETTPPISVTSAFYVPEAAGVLSGAVSFSLTALERAVRELTQPEADVSRSGAAILYWLGLSSWLLGGAVAYEVVRRRRVAAGGDPDLPDLFLEGLS
jgi:hypothetical protein